MLSKAGLKHVAPLLNSGSQVVMRADFNVPIKDGKIQDPNRIKGKDHITQPLYPQFKKF